MKGKLFLILILGILLVTCGRVYAQDVFSPYVIRDDESLFSQEMYPINSIDPTILSNTVGGYFPGLRGSNQLVIYTSNFGYRTNTNEFGTEAIVKGNTVSSMSGADSVIPRDGLVISGHGKAKKWINENIMLGSKIYIDKTNKVLTTYVTSDSFLYGAKEKIKEAQGLIDYYKVNFVNYDDKKPRKLISQAQSYLNKAKNNSKDVQKYSAMAIDSANDALANALPYDKYEVKGVWIRPDKYTEAEIADTVSDISKAGITNVFLETYFHGKTIFPSETMKSYGFQEQNELFVGIDPLKVWIDECHKRGIKVHIWFETFYVGNKSPQDNPQSILSVKPEWANTTLAGYNKGTFTVSLSEHNGYFIDPANPEVQDYLMCLLKEIITRYKPDGINLDYIRYPQSIAYKYSGYEQSNWGYTPYARNDFKAIYGIDPVELTKNDIIWQDWVSYRQDRVTDFVRRASSYAKNNGVFVSSVIFPDRQKALETKMQDWKTWSLNNYVQAFTPLFLTCDAKTAAVMMQDVNRNKASNTQLYAGLFITFMGGAQEDLIRQIHEARKMNASGVIIFDYAHFGQKYIDTVMERVFLQPPVEPCIHTKPYKRNKFFNKKRKPCKKCENS